MYEIENINQRKIRNTRKEKIMRLKKTFLTCDMLDKFEEYVNPENLTAEQIKEIEHCAYVACMCRGNNMNAAEAWEHFKNLCAKYAHVEIIDKKEENNMRYTRFYDGKNLLEVAILTAENVNTAEDFFSVGSLEYDPEKSAYKVDDCDYLVSVLEDYENSEGDYFECGAKEDRTSVIWNCARG